MRHFLKIFKHCVPFSCIIQAFESNFKLLYMTSNGPIWISTPHSHNLNDENWILENDDLIVSAFCTAFLQNTHCRWAFYFGGVSVERERVKNCHVLKQTRDVVINEQGQEKEVWKGKKRSFFLQYLLYTHCDNNIDDFFLQAQNQ